MIFWVASLVLLLSWLLTRVLRRYALTRSLMDVPNERSSHVVPTPRGGGVSIVLSFLMALPVLMAGGYSSVPATIAYAGAGGLVALIGFADDHGHIAARWRLLGHFVAAGWALYWLNGLAPLAVAGTQVNFGILGSIAAIVYLVWMLNLYNFMDGIDGLASVEAITTCFGSCLIYILTGHIGLLGAPFVLATAVAGFLVWNFPPAKIFMGDAGSGFLGIVLAGFALEAAWAKPGLFWSWIILLGVFVVDATWTLIHRFLRKQKLYEAHRSHAYQFAARRYASHKKVTLAVAAINVFWLLPIAIWVGVADGEGAVGLIIAYLPLFLMAYLFKAGAAQAS